MSQYASGSTRKKSTESGPALPSVVADTQRALRRELSSLLRLSPLDDVLQDATAGLVVEGFSAAELSAEYRRRVAALLATRFGLLLKSLADEPQPVAMTLPFRRSSAHAALSIEEGSGAQGAVDAPAQEATVTELHTSTQELPRSVHDAFAFASRTTPAIVLPEALGGDTVAHALFDGEDDEPTWTGGEDPTHHS